MKEYIIILLIAISGPTVLLLFLHFTSRKDPNEEIRREFGLRSVVQHILSIALLITWSLIAVMIYEHPAFANIFMVVGFIGVFIGVPTTLKWIWDILRKVS